MDFYILLMSYFNCILQLRFPRIVPQKTASAEGLPSLKDSNMKYIWRMKYLIVKVKDIPNSETSYSKMQRLEILTNEAKNALPLLRLSFKNILSLLSIPSSNLCLLRNVINQTCLISGNTRLSGQKV